MNKAKTRLPYTQVGYFGSDPELFLERDGQIIGSEGIIPDEGLTVYGDPEYWYRYYKRYGYTNEQARQIATQRHGKNPATSKTHSAFVRDGVQVELNFKGAQNCRGNWGKELSDLFSAMKNHLERNHPGVRLSFAQTVEVSRQELDRLSEKSRILGCAPSLNLHQEAGIGVDPTTYRKRSGGGHIHMSLYHYPENFHAHAPMVVTLSDILLGNTCVLIDRDPGAAERRKVYGRAGEYRLPSFGIEYRTLSNFWLRDYRLASFVTALARMVMQVIVSSFEVREEASLGGIPVITQNRVDDFDQDLLSRVDIAQVVEAINTNDFDLALKNWQGVKGWIKERVQPFKDSTALDSYGTHPLAPNVLDEFDYFVEKGTAHWFTEDPLTHWVNLSDGHRKGWESFLVTEVRQQLAASKRRSKKAA